MNQPASVTQDLVLNPEDVLFSKGDPGEIMYVVLDGKIEIWVENKVVETVEKGGIIGDLALIDKSPRSADAIALTRSIIRPVDRNRFREMVRDNPDFALAVMTIMAGRLRRWTR